MKNRCPLCGNTLVTEDTFLFTCIHCGELFTTDELKEEYGIDVGFDDDREGAKDD